MGLLKTCPNCNEMVGTNASTCFKCNYDFTLRRVRTEVDEKNKEEKQKQEKERKEQIAKQREDVIKKNPLYEYQTVKICDLSTGEPNIKEINETLEKFAEENWRLHTAMSNEIGKTMNSSGYGGMSSGTNATICATVLIFERCIKPSEY